MAGNNAPDSKPASSDAKGKGKQPEPSVPTSAAEPGAPNQMPPSIISGAATRIGASAKGLLGDLVAPNSTAETLASTTAQSKAGRAQFSSQTLDTKLPERHSGPSDRSVNRSNGDLGTFRQTPSSSLSEDLGSAGAGANEHTTEFEAYRPDAANFVAKDVLSLPANSFTDHPANMTETHQFDAGAFREEYLSRDFLPQSSHDLKSKAEVEAATWIAQFHDTAMDERSYYKNVRRHARGYSAASERGICKEDGDEVVRLLDMGIPINYGEDDGLSSVSEHISAPGHASSQAAEPEVTADDLFGIEEEHIPVARDNPMNLQPDFSMLNPRIDPVTGEALGEEQTMRDVLDRMSLLDQWGEVLDSYTDSVWGTEQLNRAREAKKQLQKAREEEESRQSSATPDTSSERPALRRLRDLMGQLQVNANGPKSS